MVLVVLDDVGYGQLGCFGAGFATPHIDRLAAAGLRYQRFHVTSICSSTRAALLTGRNHHAVGVGLTQESTMIHAGYTGRIPKSAALLPRVLGDHGYSTFAVGKWHLTPASEYSLGSPVERWPVGMGFERFYGFLGAETSQWAPDLVRDNTPCDPPRTPAEGYHLTEDLVDESIRMIQNQQQATPGKPFFCYLGTGAAHAPHHVPEQWIRPYHGAFDHGWEAERAATFERQVRLGVVPAGTTLTARPSWVPAWDSLSADERHVYARYMEVFAGFVTHTDHHLGRLFTYLADSGLAENTIVMLLSDNGASSEGGVTGTLNESSAWMGARQDLAEAIAHLDELGGHRQFNHYPWGWAWAGNAPFPLWKRYSWLGGVRTALITQWPARIGADHAGAVRPQFCHANDVYPTLLEAIGVTAPSVIDGVAQQRIDGSSFAATFTEPAAPEHHLRQYFEMHGSRAMYADGWKATTDWVSPLFGERDHIPGSVDHATDRWALFDLRADFAEAHDVSAEHPARVAELVALWDHAAEENQVLPLFEGVRLDLAEPPEYPRPVRAVYHPGGARVSEQRLPPMTGGFTMTARITLDGRSPGGGDGVLGALGDRHGGFALYVVDGHPTFAIATFGITARLRAPWALAPGTHEIAVRYAGPRARRLAMTVDGAAADETELAMPPFFANVSTGAGGLLVGRDRGFAVTDDYEPPFAFTGALHELVIDSTRPDTPAEHAAKLDAATAAD